MKDEIKKYFLSKTTRMVRQDACDHDDRVKAYRLKLISSIPWLGPHIAKPSDQDSALHMEKYAIPTTTIEGGDSRTMMEDKMEPHMGGVTT